MPTRESTLFPPIPGAPWQMGELSWDLRQPLVMGVLNTTPDSFSDGGDFLDPEKALARAREMVTHGAHIIDLGGASSHPQAPQVSAQEELDRVGPLVERLLAEVPLPLSIDTQQPMVAEACLEMGAHLINDVSGLPTDAMAHLSARYDVPLVIMFNNLAEPRDEAVPIIEATKAFFVDRFARAEAAGVKKIVLDPGYGFGKSLDDNLALLRGVARLMEFERPLLVCTSRKGSLGKITGEKDPKQRVGATLASSLLAVAQGAAMIRVHDVREFRQALDTWLAVGTPTTPE